VSIGHPPLNIGNDTTHVEYAAVDPTDTDEDGVIDLRDNCIDDPNPDQSDQDLDGNGDACDSVFDSASSFDLEGRTLIFEGTVVPNTPPTANAEAGPLSGVAPLEVRFSGSGEDSDGSISSYGWTFGDGTVSTVQSPMKIFERSGTYNVALTVTDDRGATAEANVTIEVTPGEGENQAPTGSIEFSSCHGPAPLSVDFVARASDPDGIIDSSRGHHRVRRSGPRA